MDDWAHLDEIVTALVAVGNRTAEGGWRPTQGGMERELVDSLDPSVVGAFVAADDRLDFSEADDELSCSHCWARIYGRRAAARYAEEHRTAVERRETS